MNIRYTSLQWKYDELAWGGHKETNIVVCEFLSGFQTWNKIIKTQKFQKNVTFNMKTDVHAESYTSVIKVVIMHFTKGSFSAFF